MRNHRGVHQGKFKPKHPEKYKGDPTNIIYRSGWELKVMQRLDKDMNVIRWSSEEVVVNYRSPKDSQMHRYFIDFWMQTIDEKGNVAERLLEIKPFEQTKPPRKTDNRARYLEEIIAYGVNLAKWEAATKFAAKKGMTFSVLTEKDLFF